MGKSCPGPFLFLALLILAMPVSAVEPPVGIDAVLLEAKVLISVKKQPEEAIATLIAQIPFFAGDSRLWVALAIAFESTDRKLEALNAYQEAQKIKPAPVIVKKIEILKEALGLTGNNAFFFPRELFKASVKDSHPGRLRFSFQEFVRRVTEDPKLLGVDDFGLVNSALQHYQGRLPQNQAEDLYYLAIFQALAGNVPVALEHFRTFVRTFPTSPFLPDAQKRLTTLEHLERALALEQEKAARELALKASADKPLAPLATSTAGIGSATKIIEPKLVIIPPDTRPAKEKMAEARQLLEAGKLHKATAMMEDALEAGGGEDDFLMLGDTYMAMSKSGDPGGEKNALLTYRKILEQHPNSPKAQVAREKIMAMQPPYEQRVKEVRQYFEKHGFPEDRQE